MTNEQLLTPKKLFALSKSIFKASNILFVITLAMIIFSLYEISPDGQLYQLNSEETISYDIYRSNGQRLDIALSVVEDSYEGDDHHNYNKEYDNQINDGAQNIEEYASLPILSVLLTNELGDILYVGELASWSFSMTAEEGFYTVTVKNISDKAVDFIVGYGELTLGNAGLIVIAAILLAVALILFAIALTITFYTGVYVISKKIYDEIQKNENERFERFIKYQEMQKSENQ